MTNISTTMEDTAATDQNDESISFLSLVRKLGAFTMLVFMFHLAFPLAKLNAYLVVGLGMEPSWYASMPLAFFIAAMNSLIAVLAFKFVK